LSDLRLHLDGQRHPTGVYHDRLGIATVARQDVQKPTPHTMAAVALISLKVAAAWGPHTCSVPISAYATLSGLRRSMTRGFVDESGARPLALAHDHSQYRYDQLLGSARGDSGGAIVRAVGGNVAVCLPLKSEVILRCFCRVKRRKR
jgi:hypothetical protein